MPRRRDPNSLSSRVAAFVWDCREAPGTRRIVHVQDVKDAFSIPSATAARCLFQLESQGRIESRAPGAYYAPARLPRPKTP